MTISRRASTLEALLFVSAEFSRSRTNLQFLENRVVRVFAVTWELPASSPPPVATRALGTVSLRQKAVLALLGLGEQSGVFWRFAKRC